MSLLNRPFEKIGAAPVDACWYAVHTRHQHEKLVARTLANKGYEVFLPLYTEVRQWRDRTKRLELPLFSCYVFLRGDLDRRLAIVATPGVHGMVATAGRLAEIPEEEIQAVRSVVENRVNVEPHPFLKCGDLVRVKSGALRGLEGFLVRKKGQTRLVVSVSLLERSVAAEVDARTVERIAGSQSGPVPLIADAAMDRGWGFGDTLLQPTHPASS
ncbi:MAG TPA: UpxY family transcription antiterminator [Terriglobia bacterium]|nr:UpxY family transcription antiterminator [Terriglobia bacterium]